MLELKVQLVKEKRACKIRQKWKLDKIYRKHPTNSGREGVLFSSLAYRERRGPIFLSTNRALRGRPSLSSFMQDK